MTTQPESEPCAPDAPLAELGDAEFIELAMSKAKICKGTEGPFAYIPGIAEHGARGPWGKNDKDALALLRAKLAKHARTLKPIWQRLNP